MKYAKEFFKENIIAPVSYLWEKILRWLGFPICGACNKARIHVKKRKYFGVKGISGHITSQSELCRKCYNGFKTII